MRISQPDRDNEMPYTNIQPRCKTLSNMKLLQHYFASLFPFHFAFTRLIIFKPHSRTGNTILQRDFRSENDIIAELMIKRKCCTQNGAIGATLTQRVGMIPVTVCIVIHLLENHLSFPTKMILLVLCTVSLCNTRCRGKHNAHHTHKDSCFFH